jgi:hypothetical protein
MRPPRNMYEFAHLVDGPDVSQHAPINTEVLKDAAAQVGADIVAVALPREAAGTVDHHRDHVLASGIRSAKRSEPSNQTTTTWWTRVATRCLPRDGQGRGRQRNKCMCYASTMDMTVAYLLNVLYDEHSRILYPVNTCLRWRGNPGAIAPFARTVARRSMDDTSHSAAHIRKLEAMVAQAKLQLNPLESLERCHAGCYSPSLERCHAGCRGSRCICFAQQSFIFYFPSSVVVKSASSSARSPMYHIAWQNLRRVKDHNLFAIVHDVTVVSRLQRRA